MPSVRKAQQQPRSTRAVPQMLCWTFRKGPLEDDQVDPDGTAQQQGLKAQADGNAKPAEARAPTKPDRAALPARAPAQVARAGAFPASQPSRSAGPDAKQLHSMPELVRALSSPRLTAPWLEEAMELDRWSSSRRRAAPPAGGGAGVPTAYSVGSAGASGATDAPATVRATLHSFLLAGPGVAKSGTVPPGGDDSGPLAKLPLAASWSGPGEFMLNKLSFSTSSGAAPGGPTQGAPKHLHPAWSVGSPSSTRSILNAPMSTGSTSSLGMSPEATMSPPRCHSPFLLSGPPVWRPYTAAELHNWQHARDSILLREQLGVIAETLPAGDYPPHHHADEPFSMDEDDGAAEAQEQRDSDSSHRPVHTHMSGVASSLRLMLVTNAGGSPTLVRGEALQALETLAATQPLPPMATAAAHHQGALGTTGPAASLAATEPSGGGSTATYSSSSTSQGQPVRTRRSSATGSGLSGLLSRLALAPGKPRQGEALTPGAGRRHSCTSGGDAVEVAAAAPSSTPAVQALWARTSAPLPGRRIVPTSAVALGRAPSVYLPRASESSPAAVAVAAAAAAHTKAPVAAHDVMMMDVPDPGACAPPPRRPALAAALLQALAAQGHKV